MVGKTSKWQKMIGKHRMPLLKPKKFWWSPNQIEKLRWVVSEETRFSYKIKQLHELFSNTFFANMKKAYMNQNNLSKTRFWNALSSTKMTFPKHVSNGKFGAWIVFLNTFCDSLKQTIETRSTKIVFAAKLRISGKLQWHVSWRTKANSSKIAYSKSTFFLWFSIDYDSNFSFQFCCFWCCDEGRPSEYSFGIENKDWWFESKITLCLYHRKKTKTNRCHKHKRRKQWWSNWIYSKLIPTKRMGDSKIL